MPPAPTCKGSSRQTVGPAPDQPWKRVRINQGTLAAAAQGRAPAIPDRLSGLVMEARQGATAGHAAGPGTDCMEGWEGVIPGWSREMGRFNLQRVATSIRGHPRQAWAAQVVAEPPEAAAAEVSAAASAAAGPDCHHRACGAQRPRSGKHL